MLRHQKEIDEVKLSMNKNDQHNKLIEEISSLKKLLSESTKSTERLKSDHEAQIKALTESTS